MKRVFKILFPLLLLVSFTNVTAQELNCSVQINSSQIQGSDQSVFEVMEKNVFEFMNSTT